MNENKVVFQVSAGKRLFVFRIQLFGIQPVASCVLGLEKKKASIAPIASHRMGLEKKKASIDPIASQRLGLAEQKVSIDPIDTHATREE